MRDYGAVQTRFWSNPDIQELSDQAKLLALYLLTGPHTTMLGCFRLPVGYVAEDLKWSVESVAKRFSELFHKGFITRDEASGWVLIHRFLEWNPIENPNQGKSIRRLFEQVPEKSSIYQCVIEILLAHGKHLDELFRDTLETLSQPFRNQEQDQDQDQDQDQEQNQKQEQNQGQDSGGAQSTSDCLPEPVSTTVTPSVIQRVGQTVSQTPSSETAISIIVIPLNDKTDFPIPQNQIDEWQSLYPIIDVLQTLRHIRAWNLANPKRRKTRNGILNHITRWLTKEQNQASNKQEKKVVSHSANHMNEHNLAIAQRWLNQSEKTIVDGEVVVTALPQEVSDDSTR